MSDFGTLPPFSPIWSLFLDKVQEDLSARFHQSVADLSFKAAHDEKYSEQRGASFISCAALSPEQHLQGKLSLLTRA